MDSAKAPEMDTTEELEIAGHGHYMGKQQAMEEALKVLEAAASSEDSEYNNRQRTILVACELMNDVYQSIAAYLDEFSCDTAKLLRNEVDPGKEDLIARARNDLKLAYPRTKDFFEAAEHLLALWLKEPDQASHVSKIFVHLGALIEYSMLTLDAFHILHYCGKNLLGMRIVAVTIVEIISQLSANFTTLIADNPWSAKFLEKIMGIVFRHILQSEIDMRLIYQEDYQENTYDADDACPICKDLLRNNPEDEASECRPRTRKCNTCRNIFHYECISLWRQSGVGGDDDRFNCPLCRCEMNQVEIFDNGTIVDAIEKATRRWG